RGLTTISFYRRSWSAPPYRTGRKLQLHNPPSLLLCRCWGGGAARRHCSALCPARPARPLLWARRVVLCGGRCHLVGESVRHFPQSSFRPVAKKRIQRVLHFDA